MTTVLEIRDWRVHQHYGKRRPPWIKMYGRLLDNADFGALPELAQAQLMKLWLLASRMGHPLPNDPKMLAGRIGVRGRFYLSDLIASGWLKECEINASNDPPTDASVWADEFSPLAGADARSRKKTENREQRTETASSSARDDSSPFENSDEPEFPADAMSDADQGKAFEGLAVQLPTVADQKALSAIIKACGNPTAWLSEMAVSLDGMHGFTLTVKQLGEVLRDYVGNGHHERPNFKHFRAYLRRPDRPSNGTKPHGMTPGERTYQNAMAAIPETPGDGESR